MLNHKTLYTFLACGPDFFLCRLQKVATIIRFNFRCYRSALPSSIEPFIINVPTINHLWQPQWFSQYLIWSMVVWLLLNYSKFRFRCFEIPFKGGLVYFLHLLIFLVVVNDGFECLDFISLYLLLLSSDYLILHLYPVFLISLNDLWAHFLNHPIHRYSRFINL